MTKSDKKCTAFGGLGSIFLQQIQSERSKNMQKTSILHKFTIKKKFKNSFFLKKILDWIYCKFLRFFANFCYSRLFITSKNRVFLYPFLASQTGSTVKKQSVFSYFTAKQHIQKCKSGTKYVQKAPFFIKNMKNTIAFVPKWPFLSIKKGSFFKKWRFLTNLAVLKT